jgi:hypothetical protein
MWGIDRCGFDIGEKDGVGERDPAPKCLHVAMVTTQMSHP